MAVLTAKMARVIEAALGQARAELIRMYSDEDIGKVEMNCGKGQIRVKALPERINEPVKFEE